MLILHAPPHKKSSINHKHIYELANKSDIRQGSNLKAADTARLVDRWRELEGYISNRPTQTISP